MDVYAQIAHQIIKQQETIIGPVAIEQANLVQGLQVDWNNQNVNIVDSDKLTVIDRLVDQYQLLFGKISVEVCREAARKLLADLAPEQQPASLK